MGEAALADASGTAWPVAEREGGGAVGVVVASGAGSAGVRLAGFESRALKASLDASAQRVRHLYVTSWEGSETLVTATASVLVLGSRRGETGFGEASPSPAGGTERFGGLSFAAPVSAGRAASAPLAALDAALSLLRVRLASTSSPRLVLLTAGAHAHGASAAPGSHHAGSLGLARLLKSAKNNALPTGLMATPHGLANCAAPPTPSEKP